MDENIKTKIIDSSNHQFIFGRNSTERQILLKEIELENPIKTNIAAPTAIYVPSKDFPNISFHDESIILRTAIRNYFNFLISEKIIVKLENDFDIQNSYSKLELFLKKINSELVNRSLPKITSLQELRIALLKAKEFYEAYCNSFFDENNQSNIGQLQISFIEIEYLVHHLKTLMNNGSYFALLIDHQSAIMPEYTMRINDIINQRCNSEISIKVALSPGEWTTPLTTSGAMIQDPYDYESIYLDETKLHRLKQKNKSL